MCVCVCEKNIKTILLPVSLLVRILAEKKYVEKKKRRRRRKKKTL